MIAMNGRDVHQLHSTAQTPTFHSLFALADWIFADERSILNHPGKFTLHSAKRYGLELWKARQIYDMGMAKGNHGTIYHHDLSLIPPNLFLGRDKKSFYLTAEDRDYQGHYEDGTKAEIDGALVSDTRLDLVIKAIDKEIIAHLKTKFSRGRDAISSTNNNTQLRHEEIDSGIDNGRRSQQENPGEGEDATALPTPGILEASDYACRVQKLVPHDKGPELSQLGIDITKPTASKRPKARPNPKSRLTRRQKEKSVEGAGAHAEERAADKAPAVEGVQGGV